MSKLGKARFEIEVDGRTMGCTGTVETIDVQEEVEKIMAWQSHYPIRTVSGPSRLKVTLLDWAIEYDFETED